MACMWAAAMNDHRGAFFTAFWITAILAVATVVSGLMHTGLIRLSYLVGGLLTAAGTESFKFVGESSINIGGVVACVLGVVALIVGVVGQRSRAE